uniref:Uncharacterized protein n=1 Tax=Oryza sativa subsp. japonica TaxID=39947 RepID=Q6ZCA4_ORYSJ|nr:hypothetical protein [Oryza sativa Japonica Group]
MCRAWPAGPSCRAGPTVPGQPSVPVGRPRHGPMVGPGQHGPDPSRAVPCLGRAKKACRGPGLRASGLMANYRLKQSSQAHRLVLPWCIEQEGSFLRTGDDVTISCSSL